MASPEDERHKGILNAIKRIVEQASGRQPEQPPSSGRTGSAVSELVNRVRKNEGSRFGLSEQEAERRGKALQNLREKVDEKAQHLPSKTPENTATRLEDLPRDERLRLLREEAEEQMRNAPEESERQKHERQIRILDAVEQAPENLTQEQRFDQVADLLNENWQNFDEYHNDETSALDALIIDELDNYVTNPEDLTEDELRTVFDRANEPIPQEEHEPHDILEDAEDPDEQEHERRGRRPELREFSVEQLEDQIEDYLDQIELSGVEVRIEFNRDIQAIADCVRYLQDKDPMRAAEARLHVNTLVASHNIYINLLQPPLDRTKQGSINENLKYLTTKGLLNEYTRKYGHVENAVGEMNKFIEFSIPLQMAQKANHTFEYIDLGDDSFPSGALWANIQGELGRKYGNDRGVLSDKDRARIDRRSIRTSMVSGRLIYQIAANTRLPDDWGVDPLKFENIPFDDMVKLYRTSDRMLVRFDIQNGHERDVIFDAWGHGDHTEAKTRIDMQMADFSDSYSVGFKATRILEAMDKKDERYKDFGLWMRFREAHGLFNQSPEVRLGKRRPIIDQIVQRDTHILPFAELFRNDDNFKQLLQEQGFDPTLLDRDHPENYDNYDAFYTTVAPALNAKLQEQLNQRRVDISLEDLPEQYRDVLIQNEAKIRAVQDFVAERKEQIVNDVVQIQEHGVTYDRTLTVTQQKTLSVADVPFEILKDDTNVASQPTFFYRSLSGDFWQALAINENLVAAVAHPENFTVVDKLIPELEKLGGRGAADRFIRYGIPAYYELYKPRWFDRFIPNEVFEQFHWLHPNKISEIRGFTPSMYTGQWMRRIEMWENQGLIAHGAGDMARRITHARFMNRIPGILGWAILAGIGTGIVVGVAQGQEDLQHAGASAPGGGGGGVH